MGSNDIKIAVKELLKGHEAAHKLKSSPLPREDLLSLCKIILSSFTRVITMLAHKLYDEGGPNKRKEISWGKDTSFRCDDGFEWRKYGKKNIVTFESPRNYYRCVHKYDQHCPATKHEQKLNGESAGYRTTYYGHHTCAGSGHVDRGWSAKHRRVQASSRMVIDFENGSAIAAARSCSVEVPESSSGTQEHLVHLKDAFFVSTERPKTKNAADLQLSDDDYCGVDQFLNLVGEPYGLTTTSK